jgi:integrase
MKRKGCFDQKNDGTWEIDTKVKIDNEWKHFKKGGYETLSQAKADFERAKNEFISKKEKGKNGVVLFNHLIKEYLSMRKVTMNVSTVECDESTFKIYIAPFFQNKLIKDCLNETNVSFWFENLVNDSSISDGKKSKVITRMKDFLKFAYMHKFITADTYQDCDVCLYQIKYSKKAKTERIIWSEIEEKNFLKATEKDAKHNLMFKMFFLTSPRLGEFLAFQPSSIDFENSRIKINKQVKNVRGLGSTLTERLKTNESYRDIAIPKDVLDELSKYIEDFNLKQNHFLWFYGSKDKPMSRNTIRRLFNHYCSISGVRRMNLHSIRHNQAVKLASVCKTGDEIEIASRRLGHSPSMFMNTYANHINEEKEKELLKRMFVF